MQDRICYNLKTELWQFFQSLQRTLFRFKSTLRVLTINPTFRQLVQTYLDALDLLFDS